MTDRVGRHASDGIDEGWAVAHAGHDVELGLQQLRENRQDCGGSSASTTRGLCFPRACCDDADGMRAAERAVADTRGKAGARGT